jgi:mRNA interferase MazF
MSTSIVPSRVDVWLTDLNPTRGHEQAGVRPALIPSEDIFNHGPAGLSVVLPITSRSKGIASHVPVAPPEGGLTQPSFVKCEDVRSVSHDRLIRRLGAVTSPTMDLIEDRVRILLGL